MKTRFLPLFGAFFLMIFGIQAQTEIKVYTNMGEFKLLMFDTLMPITAGNFITLTEDGYYDGVIFHRVIDDFMIQGGDPTGTGSGGPGYTIPDEFDSTGTTSNAAQTISMANAGPNTGGSQFFINLVDNTYLDYDKPPFSSKHPVFGIVTEGFDIVQSIGEVATNNQDRPLNDVVMDSVRVIEQTPSAIEHPLSNSGMVIYPNPVAPGSQLTLHSSYTEQAMLRVISTIGKTLITKEVTLLKGNTALSMPDLTMLTPGVYLIQINSDRNTYSGRIIYR